LIENNEAFHLTHLDYRPAFPAAGVKPQSNPSKTARTWQKGQTFGSRLVSQARRWRSQARCIPDKTRITAFARW